MRAIDMQTTRFSTAARFFVLGAGAFLACASLEPQPPSPTPPTPPPPLPPGSTGYPEGLNWDPEEWIRLPYRISFPAGDARLDDDARDVLREARDVMTRRADIVRIRVEGHADGRGSSAANDAFAMELAEGVVDFMVGGLGMSRELFQLRSYGDTRPLTDETTPADRVSNTRVEFSVIVARRQAVPR